MKLPRSSAFATILVVGALSLFSASAFLYWNGWDQEATDPTLPAQRYEWLLDPVDERFPPADQIFEVPGFRVAGVHYWQGNSNFNFWTNLKTHRIDEDFRRIREHGFNTILLSVSWGYFQTNAYAPTYKESAFEKLGFLMEAAARNRLYVILRVGTHDQLPEGVRGRNYFAPYLLVDDRELAAFCDLFRETARRLADRDNLLFLFFSWEDLWGHVEVSLQDSEYRMDFMDGAGAFRRYLSQKDIAHWNQRWRTNYSSLEEIPFPAYGSPAYADFFEFADGRLLDVLLPAVASAAREGSADVRLSFEIRVDQEPIWWNSEPDWIDHRRTWNLVDDYQVVSAYYNPYWGASTRGGFISAEKAVEYLDYLLAAMEESIAGKPVFFNQLNFTDATPWLQPYSPRLKGEDDIARFLELSLDKLEERSLGYAIWAFRAFEDNSLYNSSFEDGLTGWQAEDSERLRVQQDDERRERSLTLEPGGIVHQDSRLELYPDPFDLRFFARSEPGGRLTVQFESGEASSPKNLAFEELIPTAEWHEYSLRLPTAKKYRLTLESSGSGPVHVDDLSLSQYVQTSSVLDLQGEPLGRRSEILKKVNLAWKRRSGRVNLGSPSSWSQEDLVRAGYAYADGWLPQDIIVPLLIPWFNSAIELEFYLPENELGASGNSVRIQLGSRLLGEYELKPGPNRIDISLRESLHPGRWPLRLYFARALRPKDYDSSSQDTRALGAVALTIRVQGRGQGEQQWKTELSQTQTNPHIEAAVRVVGSSDAPLEKTLVVGHGGGHVGAAQTDSNGEAILQLELEPQGSQPTPIFIEVLDPRAQVSSVKFR